MLAVRIYRLYVFIAQQVGIDLLLAVDDIPKILAYLVCILHSYDFKPLCVVLFVHVFHHSQQDGSSIGVGKCGVCFPQGMRDAVLSPLAFKRYALAVRDDGV